MSPMSSAAEDRAVEVADAAEHGGGEGDETELEAEVVARVVPTVSSRAARRAGHRAAEGEGEGDRPVDVDAHQPGRVLVLGRRPHRLALPGLGDDQVRIRSSGTVTAMTTMNCTTRSGRRRS